MRRLFGASAALLLLIAQVEPGQAYANAVDAKVISVGGTPSAETSATFESVRLEIISVAVEMNPSMVRDADYSRVGNDLAALQQHLHALTPRPHYEPVLASLQKDVGMLTDAYAVWSYALLNDTQPRNVPIHVEALSTAKLPGSDPLYSTLRAKYGADPHVSAFKTDSDGVYASLLMISLTVSAESDAKYLSGKFAAAKLQGTGSLRVRYPLTSGDVQVAVQVGSHSDEMALLGEDMEWYVLADRSNEGDTTPHAVMQTPFFKVAMYSAQRKAKYETMPTTSALLKNPSLKNLTADIYIESGLLNAFDEAVCIIKQGGSVIRASSKSVDHPSVTSGAKYAYEILCDFPMDRLNPQRPFAVTLANVILFNTDQGAGAEGMKRGELHFNVDPAKMR